MKLDFKFNFGRLAPQEPPAPKKCPECGTVFESKTRTKIFCSNRCQTRVWRKINKHRGPGPKLTTPVEHVTDPLYQAEQQKQVIATAKAMSNPDAAYNKYLKDDTKGGNK